MGVRDFIRLPTPAASTTTASEGEVRSRVNVFVPPSAGGEIHHLSGDVRRLGGAQDAVDDVCDVCEVARLLAVAVNARRLARHRRLEELRYHAAVRIVRPLRCPEDDVSVAIEDVEPADWTERVYEPDIIGKGDRLYKKPGY